MIAGLILMTVQGLPPPSPGLCAVVPIYVEMVADSETLHRERYKTATEAEAGEKRQAELNGLAGAVRKRFGRVRSSSDDVYGMARAGSVEEILALAHACLALPR